MPDLSVKPLLRLEHHLLCRVCHITLRHKPNDATLFLDDAQYRLNFEQWINISLAYAGMPHDSFVLCPGCLEPVPDSTERNYCRRANAFIKRQHMKDRSFP